MIEKQMGNEEGNARRKERLEKVPGLNTLSPLVSNDLMKKEVLEN